MSKKYTKSVLPLNEDIGKYAGQFVGISDFNSRIVIAAGQDPLAVKVTAKNAGYANPVIFYVPRNDEKLILNKKKLVIGHNNYTSTRNLHKGITDDEVYEFLSNKPGSQEF